jgi:hypothetical protein
MLVIVVARYEITRVLAGMFALYRDMCDVYVERIGERVYIVVDE